MLLFATIFLIEAHDRKSCTERIFSEQAETRVPVRNEVDKTVEDSGLKLTFFNFNSEIDDVNLIKNVQVSSWSRLEFNISMVRFREEIITSKGVRFKFSIQDTQSNKHICYKPDALQPTSNNLQFLNSSVLGFTTNSTDYYITVYKSNRPCQYDTGSSSVGSDEVVSTSPSFTSSTTTSSPEKRLEVFVLISVIIIEPLRVELDLVSEKEFKVSVSNLNSLDRTSPVIRCFVNDVDITNSPHFKIPSKLREAPLKNNKAKFMTITMKCWNEVNSGPVTCSASRGDFTYWSSPLYLSKNYDLEDCEPGPELNLNRVDGSEVTRISWNCSENKISSYIVHISNRVSEEERLNQYETKNEGLNQRGNYSDQKKAGNNLREVSSEMTCPLRLKTQEGSCYLETDILRAGTSYQIWVTSADNTLVVDMKHVLIPGDNQKKETTEKEEEGDNQENNKQRVVFRLLIVLVFVIVIVVVVLVWRCWRGRGGERKYTESDEHNFEKENLEGFDSSDIVIVHIGHSSEAG